MVTVADLKCTPLDTPMAVTVCTFPQSVCRYPVCRYPVCRYLVCRYLVCRYLVCRYLVCTGG